MLPESQLSTNVWFAITVATAIAAWPRTRVPQRIVSFSLRFAQLLSCILLLLAAVCRVDAQYSAKLWEAVESRFSDIATVIPQGGQPDLALWVAGGVSVIAFLLRQQHRAVTTPVKPTLLPLPDAIRPIPSDVRTTAAVTPRPDRAETKPEGVTAPRRPIDVLIAK